MVKGQVKGAVKDMVKGTVKDMVKGVRGRNHSFALALPEDWGA